MTCLASSKSVRAGFYLLAFVALFAPKTASGETGIVSAVGSGREASEAIVSLLRAVVAKYFKNEPAGLSKSILQNEIVPNASSFVQSYKILEGGRGSSVSLSANVDLDVIRALLKLTPATLGEGEGAKSFVAVKGARLPDVAAYVPKAGSKPQDPYSSFESAAKERLVRRGFEVVGLSTEEQQALSPGDDVASPELLRGLGARSGARIALGISSRYESFENENSQNKEQRLVVNATLIDVKAGVVMAKSSVTVSEPKSRKEQYVADLQRSLSEESKDLFHEALVLAGKKFLKLPGREDFSLIRIQYPSNAALVSKFRTLLEAGKGVRSVVEYSITRGAFDFAVRPAMKEAALLKIVKSLVSEEISITPLDSMGQEGAGPQVALVVKISPKESDASSDISREVQSEEP